MSDTGTLTRPSVVYTALFMNYKRENNWFRKGKFKIRGLKIDFPTCYSVHLCRDSIFGLYSLKMMTPDLFALGPKKHRLQRKTAAGSRASHPPGPETALHPCFQQAARGTRDSNTVENNTSESHHLVNYHTWQKPRLAAVIYRLPLCSRTTVIVLVEEQQQPQQQQLPLQ